MEGDERPENGDGQPAVSEINLELTQILVDVGGRMGFKAVTEYAVPGGRLDVVWLWEPPSAIPGVYGTIPVAGFEIESAGERASTSRVTCSTCRTLASPWG